MGDLEHGLFVGVTAYGHVLELEGLAVHADQRRLIETARDHGGPLLLHLQLSM